ncbi:MAG: hypothetical protein IJ934_00320 [Acetobacter sp.]|nr:hypothetical protein [Acetobacter sp.]
MTESALSTTQTEKTNNEEQTRLRMEAIIRLAHVMPTASRFELMGVVQKLSDTEFEQTEDGQALLTYFNTAIEKYFEKNRLKKQKNRKKKS